MSSVVLYNPSDSTVPGRVTDYLLRANTPDYDSNPNALINPDLSMVSGVEQRFWKVSDSTVVSMNDSDKSSMLPGIKIDHKTYLQNQAHSVIDLQYRTAEQSAINSIFSDSQKSRINRHLYYQNWANWLDTVETEIYNKVNLVDDKTSITDVENIAIDVASLIASDPQIKVEDGIGITDSSSLVNFLDANASVTDPYTSVVGPYYLMEILNLRRQVFNDSTNPVYVPGLTPIIGSNGYLVEHANRISILETEHQKLGWHEQEVFKANYVYPKELLIYYGWLNSFNSATNLGQNEKVARDMARYDLLVFGDGIENPSHGDYANTQIIIPRIKNLNASSLVFGYVAVAQDMSSFQTKVDQWNMLQVDGIFLDEAGYDFGTDRSGFNARVNYVHGKTYSKLAFANAWNTDHILGTTNDPSYPNSTYNPGLVSSTLNIYDWILLESFPINTASYTGGYESASDWAARGVKMETLRVTYGVNFAAGGVINNANVNGNTLFKFGLTSSLMWSLEAYGTSDTDYGSSSAAVKYWDRPNLAGLGRTWTLNPSIQEGIDSTNSYYCYSGNAVMSLDFTDGAQQSSINMKGYTGLQGATGIQGSTGTGGVGTQGITGIQGGQGNQGLTGIQGSTGIGSSGSTGIQGFTGLSVIGATGVQGQTGVAAIAGTYNSPVPLLVYYGWLNSFNSGVNAWTNEKVAQDMAKYQLLVFGNGLEVPSHGDYANTQIIIPRVQALNNNALVFGYVATNIDSSSFQTKVSQWDTLHVNGILMDMAGYDYGTDRSGFNSRVDYIHSKTYAKTVFANAWNPDHILGTNNDVSYPNSTYNPGLVASHLTPNDWVLLESFPINTDNTGFINGVESGTEWSARGVKMGGLRSTYNVKFAAVGILSNSSATGAVLFNYGYVSSLMWSLNAFGTSDSLYASSSAAVTFWPRPNISATRSMWAANPDIQVGVDNTNVYHRYIETTHFSLDVSNYSSSISTIGNDGFNTTAENSCTQRILMSPLAPGSAGFLLISGTAYFVYLGRIVNSFCPKYVEFHVSTSGAGTQTAEVGFFSTPNAPSKVNQSLTKLVSTGTMTSLTSTGVKRNTAAFTTQVLAGTHLWAGIRTAMGTTQPTIWGLSIDLGQGQILSTAASGVLTGAGPWTGAIITASTSVVCPDLRGTLD